MRIGFIDTDPIIRYLTGDDPEKQEAVYQLLRQVQLGQVILLAPISVIADAVYVLSSPRTYRLPRSRIVTGLLPIIQIPGFRVDQKQVVLRALDIYVETNLDFSDALIVASMERAGIETLFTYDRHFDRVQGIRRTDPGEPEPRTGANGAQP